MLFLQYGYGNDGPRTRLATFMFYVSYDYYYCTTANAKCLNRKARTNFTHDSVRLKLNEVDMGGGTAFAQAGVLITPKPGSAIFWYNLLSSGVWDEHTHHGSCPVILGEKHSRFPLLHGFLFSQV